MADKPEKKKKRTCRFWHNWGPWSDPKPAIAESILLRYEYEVLAQHRICQDCNEYEIKALRSGSR